LKRLAATGEITPDDPVWKDGTDDRVPAKRVKGLFPVDRTSAPAVTHSPSPSEATATATDSADDAEPDRAGLIKLLSRVGAAHDQWDDARRRRTGLRTAALGAAVVLGLLAAIGLPGMCLLSTLAVGRSVSARGGSNVSVSPAGIAVLVVGMAGLGIAAAGIGIVGHRRLRGDPPAPPELDAAIRRLTDRHPAAVARWGGADALADPTTVRELLDQLRPEPERAFPSKEPDVAPLADPPEHLPSDPAEAEEPRPRKRDRGDERSEPRRDRNAAPPLPSPSSSLPVLEIAGVWDGIKAETAKGRGRGPGQLFCRGCSTRLKMPPKEKGRQGTCPNCQGVVKFPMSGTAAEMCAEAAAMLRLDLSSATIRHALAHAVTVLHPVAGTGGELLFLQMKVVCDQIRENSSNNIREMLNGIAREAGVPTLPPMPTVANLEDPLVVAAGTPWKLFLWLTAEFGGYHKTARLQGGIGHPNPDVNLAYFIVKNNAAYPDDPCRKYSDDMLANLMEMAKQHAEALGREMEHRRELSTHGRRCSSCQGKGWFMIGTPSEQRCSVCGGQGVVRQ